MQSDEENISFGGFCRILARITFLIDIVAETELIGSCLQADDAQWDGADDQAEKADNQRAECLCDERVSMHQAPGS
jgi:hypothetical protein